MQRAATARMSQLALGYRDSPLSANHAHAGDLHAGDRVPDLGVRHRAAPGWADAALQDLLDPSRFVLLVAHDDAAEALDPALRDAARGCGADVAVAELAPPAAPEARRRYAAALGGSAIYLVRPDGYIALAAGARAGATRLAAYTQHWLSPRAPAHAG